MIIGSFAEIGSREEDTAMGIDVMIVGLAEGIARPRSLEIMEWLHERWQEFEIPYGFIEFAEADIQELEARFGHDPVGQMLLKRIGETREYVESNGHQVDMPFTVELMISY
jgi:hypothetical protein